jgi:hypothetical protein
MTIDQPITRLDQLDPLGIYTYADYLKWQFDERVELFKGKLFPILPASAFLPPN